MTLQGRPSRALFIILVAIIGVIFLVGTKTVDLSFSQNEEVERVDPLAVVDDGSSEEVPELKIDVKAKAVLVYDITGDKVIYENNADLIFPLASLTKIMTAFIALEETQPDAVVKLSKNAIGQPGDEGLLVDDEWLVDDLVQILLATSSNDAAVALQEDFAIKSETTVAGVNNFVRLMNRQANRLGLENTQFVDGSGLDVTKNLGSSSGSLRDVQILSATFLKSYLEFSRLAARSEFSIENNNKTYLFYNTNEELKNIPGVVFSKTGYTDVAGGHVVIIIEPEPGQYYFIGMMGSTFPERFSDLLLIYEAFVQAVYQTDTL